MNSRDVLILVLVNLGKLDEQTIQWEEQFGSQENDYEKQKGEGQSEDPRLWIKI